MRRGLFGAVVALVVIGALVAWPAQAQTPTTRSLIDAVVKVAPGEDSGFCLRMESGGTVAVMLQTVDDHDSDPLGPPKFMLAPYRTSPPGPNAPPEIWDLPATAARTSIELPVVANLYCFNLSLTSTPEINGLPSRERTARFRYVSLRMTLIAD